MKISNLLKEKINKALENIGIDSIPEITLERPDEISNGDYSTNVALVLAKPAKKNPKDLAYSIAEALQKDLPDQVEKIEVAGPGFINFYLSNSFFANEINNVVKQAKKYGSGESFKNKTVIVEYSSPNIAKPFTVGHLRSTIIGDAIASILGFSGAKVVRDNHLGDWGTQFGKLIVAIKRWGDLDKIKKSKEPVKDLVALYVKFHDEAEKNKALDDEARGWFTKLERKDKEATVLWKLCVTLSLKEFKRIYERLGIGFDTMVGESFFEDKMADVMFDTQKKNVAKVSEGATLVFFESDPPGSETSKYPPLMLLKSDGSSLYALRDLATDKWRKKKYGKDAIIINEVGSEQALYFRQIFEAEKLLGYSNGKDRFHVAHGLYRFEDGKMSTRKGNTIWLEDVLNEAVIRASKFNPDIAEDVGIGALKFNDLKRESAKEIVFNWDDILNMSGDSGPYVQYSFARANSIIKKATKAKIKLNTKIPKDWKTTNLERIIERFPEVVERAARELAPNHIANYLLELASVFSSFYNGTIIIDKSKEAPYKVAITKAFSIVMKNGLEILGIKALPKM